VIAHSDSHGSVRSMDFERRRNIRGSSFPDLSLAPRACRARWWRAQPALIGADPQPVDAKALETAPTIRLRHQKRRTPRSRSPTQASEDLLASAAAPSDRIRLTAAKLPGGSRGGDRDRAASSRSEAQPSALSRTDPTLSTESCRCDRRPLPFEDGDLLQVARRSCPRARLLASTAGRGRSAATRRANPARPDSADNEHDRTLPVISGQSTVRRRSTDVVFIDRVAIMCRTRETSARMQRCDAASPGCGT